MPSRSRYSLDVLNQRYSRGQLRFQHLDLRNLSLEGIKMPFIEFVDCNLQGQNLIGAFMPGGVFSHSCLRKSKLNWANLIGSDFFLADLSGAQLNRAMLSGAKLVAIVLKVKQNFGVSAWDFWSRANCTALNRLCPGRAG